MTIPVLAVCLFGYVLIAWLLELRHREESLPSLGNRRHVAPFVAIAAAALLAIPFALWPLVSVAEWPRSTQIAWTAAESADRESGTIAIGGAEHSAVIGWPNGSFRPEVRVERAEGGGFRLRTRGGTALVRVDGAYANGDAVTLGGGPKQTGKFFVELARKGLLRRRKLIISRTPVAEPLIVMNPPEVHATRARALDALLQARLNDLRREGTLELTNVRALEEWAASIRVLRPSKNEVRLLTDDEPWRELPVTLRAGAPAVVEVLWPRRRLVMRLTDDGGTPRLSFDPPWTRTTSLPPFAENASTLSFAREPAADANTFLLPLGHGAAEFRHDAALRLAPGGLPRFRDGADLAPPADPATPRFLRKMEKGMLGVALEPNRALSSIRVPLLMPNLARASGLLLTITLVRDLPTPRALLLALGLAWLIFAGFVAAIAFGRMHRLRLRDLWCIGGVLVATWTVLLIRVLLAVRYLLTPTAIDEVTAKGLAGTLAALVIVPGFITLAVRLWLHHRPGGTPASRRLAWWRPSADGRRDGAEPAGEDAGVPQRSAIVTAAVALGLAAGSVVEFVFMPRQILPNLADLFRPSYFDRLLLVVYGVAALAIATAFGRGAIAAIWQLPYRVTFEAGRTFWRTLANTAAEPRPGHQLMRYVPRPVLRVVTALQAPALRPLVLIWLAGTAVVLVLSRVAPEYVRQIVAPFWMMGIPALLLLARPIAATEDALQVLDGESAAQGEPTHGDTVTAVVALVFAPVALMIAMLGDFGSIYAVLAFWFPLALLLLLTPAFRVAATLLAVFVVGVAIAYWALLGTYAIAPGMTEHILSRVEVMEYGSAAQEWLFDLEAPSQGDARAVTAGSVRNALVHAWEHMAMVRKGGWGGLGFNRAPASQSFIRQDTIQYDSVYSFFISAEHGIAGGLLLLAIFAVPAVLLLMRRSRLRVGDMLAIAIAAAFLGEAAAHAAMNVSQLWFSGRNLPLLATASNSDTLRWALLLGLMCQALLWSSGLRADSVEMLPETAVTRTAVFDPDFGQRRRRLMRRGILGGIVATGALVAFVTGDIAWLAFAAAIPLAMRLRRREYPALALLPALLVAVLVVRGSIRAVRSSEFEVLTWSRLLSKVDELRDQGTLRFDQAKKLILYCQGQDCTDRPSGATLLEAEVLRFNSLPVALRMDGGREALPPGFFNGLTHPEEYYTRMFELWRREVDRAMRTRPSVFAVRRVEEDTEGAPEIAYEVTGNPDYNIVHSFSEERAEEELPPVSIRGREGPVRILGRAWVMGRWSYATTREARRLGLGWMGHAGDALLRVDRSPRISELTIDGDLQRLTQAAVDAAGREGFSRLIAEGAPAPLPPRVAFTILRGTTGEVLAMSSWPRAADRDDWSSRPVSHGGRTWIERDPPFSWLSATTPRPLASRHAVDHNLAAIEIGSAAKPFWATAALTVHPRLDDLLWGRNGSCDRVVAGRCYERELFGAELGKGWQVSPRPRWIDFSTYLAASDNRYHTRLGFLGFARSDGNRIADDGRGGSGSDRESLSASNTPWNRYPALPDSTGHTRDKPQQIGNLHEQRVAALMRDLFGVRTGLSAADGDLRRRHLSFWSGNESDDLGTSDALEPLAVVSPEAVDLRLNRITRTRELIAVLLGGASSRWSNVGAAAAFSSWAMRRPVVAHIVPVNAAKPLASRTAAFDKEAAEAAAKLDRGLWRVLEDGTAIRIRSRLQPLRDRYDVYAKTGTLATIDPDRPTSRILVVIIARDGEGRPKNAITLSFVAERSSEGFATEQAGRFIDNHMAELLRLLEPEG
jgi:hypothetical protein